MMVLKRILFAGLLFAWIPLNAHQKNEAFFTIVPNETQIVVETEFPWTIRNALLQFDTSLENATSKNQFVAVFKRYFNQNFRLLDVEGNPLTFVDFKELSNQGHAHQNNYLFTYQAGGIGSIYNTVMFDLYSNQVNYHTLDLERESVSFVTTAAEPKYTFKGNTSKGLWWLLGIAVLLLIFSVQLIKRKKALTSI